jgi:hypothetical protein
MSTSTTDYTLKVPQRYVERFKYEALFSLDTAAQTVQECASWARGHDGKHGREISPELRASHLSHITDPSWPDLVESKRIFDQAYSHEGGDLEVTAAPKQVKSAITGCLLSASDAVGLAAEELDPSAATRALLEEVTFWLDHQDELDAEAE